MIRYALRCSNSHDFDSWFQSAEAHETLRKSGHVACPICGDTDVEKTLMAPTVRPARKAGDGNIAEDRRIIETNLLGAIAVIDVAMAQFKQQGSGHLVGISSVSANFAIPGSGAYSASKAALTNYLEALRLEVTKFKIAITIVHPGFVNTDIAPGMEKYPFVATPENVAREIANGIAKKKKNIVVPRLPWGLIMPVLRLIPDSIKTRVF